MIPAFNTFMIFSRKKDNFYIGKMLSALPWVIKTHLYESVEYK